MPDHHLVGAVAVEIGGPNRVALFQGLFNHDSLQRQRSIGIVEINGDARAVHRFDRRDEAARAFQASQLHFTRAA